MQCSRAIVAAIVLTRPPGLGQAAMPVDIVWVKVAIGSRVSGRFGFHDTTTSVVSLDDGTPIIDKRVVVIERPELDECIRRSQSKGIYRQVWNKYKEQIEERARTLGCEDVFNDMLEVMEQETASTPAAAPVRFTNRNSKKEQARLDRFEARNAVLKNARKMLRQVTSVCCTRRAASRRAEPCFSPFRSLPFLAVPGEGDEVVPEGGPAHHLGRIHAQVLANGLH